MVGLQEHVLGATQVPPLAQGGEHTAVDENERVVDCAYLPNHGPLTYLTVCTVVERRTSAVLRSGAGPSILAGDRTDG